MNTFLTFSRFTEAETPRDSSPVLSFFLSSADETDSKVLAWLIIGRTRVKMPH